MRIYRLMLGLLFGAIILAGDGYPALDRTLSTRRLAAAPVIDGVPEPEIWADVPVSGGFVQHEPDRGQPATAETFVRVGFDETHLYVLVECRDPSPGRIAAAVTQRDGDLEDEDAVVIMLDTFLDRNTGYLFGTNVLGTQYDSRLADNGRTEDHRWDGVWQCAAARTSTGWSAEFAIPFRTLRFTGGADTVWGLNVIRGYPRRLETAVWSGPAEEIFRVAAFGHLTGLEPGLDRGQRYDIIPYGLVRLQQGKKTTADAGVDLRYRLRNDVSVEFTVNPDFATVEADQEQINLTRFELFIPEKRPFFQEGTELYQQRVTQFYSRRIGEIPWGAKFNGKFGGWEMAFLTAASDPQAGTDGLDDEGRNAYYSVFRLKKVIIGSSNVGLLLANRYWEGDNRGSIGADMTLFFTDTLGMTAQFVRAHGPENDGKTTWFVRPAYDSSTTHFHVRYSHWDKDLKENMNVIGFIRDDDRREADTNFSRTFWLAHPFFDSGTTSNNFNIYWSQQGTLRSWEFESSNELKLASNWNIDLSVTEEFKRYEKDFRNRLISFGPEYDNRRGTSVGVECGFGRNYDSDLRLLGADVEIKLTDKWKVEYGLTRLWLSPDPDRESTWIHVLRSQYYFHRDLYVKLFFQTNSVISKENVQTVFVWRFLPPFGAFQLAYQYGTSALGTESAQGHTLFSKLSWLF
ncbi:MAG: carbohydrate binding family 9 domain-containing protein [Acidobacteria bacterium]|nr:carbohydrate binding family 9 domain-containing protein [Acidobacteriota bacterium]